MGTIEIGIDFYQVEMGAFEPENSVAMTSSGKVIDVSISIEISKQD